MPKSPCVVAVGGNALLGPRDKPSITTQQQHARKLARSLLPLVTRYRICMTHGNGPQVGNIVIRSAEALGKAYALPLDVCVAESEGEIGYILEQALINTFCTANIKMPVATLLTQVVVDPKDPAFSTPSKPIGPFYAKKDLKTFKKNKWPYVEDSGRGYRRVVASPSPQRIIEGPVIKTLLGSGVMVIAAGGGGIPVVKKHNKIIGVEAVIDKDHASSCLATSINADQLIFLTGEPSVYLNYLSSKKRIKKMTVKQAISYHAEGQFPPGSMGPKILASIDFLSSGGKRVLITSPSSLQKALRGQSGTVITK